VLALYQKGGGGMQEIGLALEAQGGALCMAPPQQVLALQSGARAAGGSVAAKRVMRRARSFCPAR
jgi:hypothetical protein